MLPISLRIEVEEMRVTRLACLCSFLLGALLFLTNGAPVAGTPLCLPPSLTFSEQVATYDVVLLAKCITTEQRKTNRPAGTTFEVTEILKGAADDLKKGKQIVIGRFRAGKVGKLFLLKGTRKKAVEWDAPTEFTEKAFRYISKVPPADTPTSKRLAFYLKYLEFSDPLVAGDAYYEIASAPFKDIVPLAKQLPRERIRGWILNPKTRVGRISLYGQMLGLCGTQEDAKAMAEKIVETNDEFRLGMDGVIAGYLMLTGDKGLALIDETKLRSTDVAFSEMYAAVQALRFMWTYGDGRIEKERLKQSMRPLLDQPELADLVILNLARWKDWSVQDRLMEMYGKEKQDIPYIKRAIVRFMIHSTKFTPSDKNAEPPEHVKNGKKHMKTLRERDPKTVREVEAIIRSYSCDSEK